MNERAELLPSTAPGLGGTSAALAAPRHTRTHDCLLHACRVFNFLTALCALLCALAFGMAMWVRGQAPIKVGCRVLLGAAGWWDFCAARGRPGKATWQSCDGIADLHAGCMLSGSAC